jgi:hypothetical protein
MNIGESFGFVFQDSRWITKLLIAAAILAVGVVFSWVLLIPLIIAAALLMGYALEITRRAINHTQPLLPEWDDWQRLIIDGIKVFVIYLVYALPAILISACLGLMAAVVQNDQGTSALSGLINAGSSCFSFLWGIVVGLLLPAAIAFFAVDGQLNSAFRFSEVIAFVRKNFSNYLIVLVLTWAVWLLAWLIGGIVCGIGLLVTIPYAVMVVGHLYGDAYRQSSGSAVTPTDVQA